VGFTLLLSTGTILEFDSLGNVIPSARTYNTMNRIDKAIVDINDPYAMSWAANSEYTYDGSSTAQALAIWDTANFGNSANIWCLSPLGLVQLLVCGILPPHLAIV